MGLFGFGKKKKQNDNVSEALKVVQEAGLEVNDGKIKSGLTRRESEELNQIMHTSSVKKDYILEKLGNLRKELYYNPDFERYCGQLEDLIAKFKRMADNSDPKAMAVVDSFILKAINDSINYSNRGNFLGMGACLSNLTGLINDRFQCGSYYLDPEFCAYLLERNRLYVEMQNIQSEYNELEQRMEQLKKDAHEIRGISVDAITREAASIREEGIGKKQTLNDLGDRIQVLDKSIKEIKQKSIMRGNGTFKMEDHLDEAVEAKRENEREAANVDKYKEELDKSHRRVSSSALNVNDGALENSTPQTLNDDIFKM